MTQTLRPQHDDARKIALTNRQGSYKLVSKSYSDRKGTALVLMKRDEMLKAFARQRKDEIVVPVYTAAQEITHISPNDLNYTFVGAMGQGSSHA